MKPSHIAIIGAGPAGLTAANALAESGYTPVVFEMSAHVGGISRTEVYKGYHTDIGGHRFYTKVPEIQALWERVLGMEFRLTSRLSRIYYRGNFYPYPLEPFTTLRQLGLGKSLGIIFSYLRWQVRPYPQENTFEEWVTNRFGKELYETFFKTYTEKVWGIPCSEIQADWAAQRIKDLTLSTAIADALLPNRWQTGEIKTLVRQFHYPLHGPGMMWQRFQQQIELQGGAVALETRVTRITHDGKAVTRITLDENGAAREFPVDHVISTMPLQTLIQTLDPPPPASVQQAAAGLRYRDFLIVGLIVKQADVFPDNWIYIHTPEVKVGRIQNFKNWSAAMVPDPQTTSLGMEYFCNVGDEIWRRTDADLIALATAELADLNLSPQQAVIDGFVIRQPKAYPVYDRDYRANLAVIKDYLAGIANLETIGRNGLHRYNNQDHSMLTGLLAAENVNGAQHDVWTVNLERSYYESFLTDKADSERLIPQKES
jgi:protoporphyrinogen oxidase